MSLHLKPRFWEQGIFIEKRPVFNGIKGASQGGGGLSFVENPRRGGFAGRGRGRRAGRLSTRNGGGGGVYTRETGTIWRRALYPLFDENSLNLCFASRIPVVFVMSVISAKPAINTFVCGCLSCLRCFRDSRRFHESTLL